MRPDVYSHPLGIFMVTMFAVLSILVVVFPVMYARSNWRANRVGRALMYQSIAYAATVLVGLVLLYITVATDYVPGEAVAALRAATYTGAAVTQGLMVRMLLRIQRGFYDSDLPPIQSPNRKARQ